MNGKNKWAYSLVTCGVPILALKETAVFCHEALPCEKSRCAAISKIKGLQTLALMNGVNEK